MLYCLSSLWCRNCDVETRRPIAVSFPVSVTSVSCIRHVGFVRAMLTSWIEGRVVHSDRRSREQRLRQIISPHSPQNKYLSQGTHLSNFLTIKQHISDRQIRGKLTFGRDLHVLASIARPPIYAERWSEFTAVPHVIFQPDKQTFK